MTVTVGWSKVLWLESCRICRLGLIIGKTFRQERTGKNHEKGKLDAYRPLQGVLGFLQRTELAWRALIRQRLWIGQKQP
jgi:hypothetical protein